MHAAPRRFGGAVSRRRVVAAAAALAVIGFVVVVVRGPAGDTLERLVGAWQNALAHGLDAPDALAGWRLYAIAFAGGLAASLSPCILGMLPVQLSYLGATGPRSRGDAVAVAAGFVGGVGSVNIVLGLVSSVFFAIVVMWRAQLNIAIGALTVVMGLWLAGIVRIRLPQVATRVPAQAGPFAVGVIFALVASPCASPVLVAVLGAAARDASPLRSVAAMAAYTIGYTAVLFAASVFAGVAVASRRLLAYGDAITRAGAAALVVLGMATIAYGFSLR